MFRTEEFDTYVKQTKVLTRVIHVNDSFPAVYMTHMGQNFFHYRIALS